MEDDNSMWGTLQTVCIDGWSYNMRKILNRMRELEDLEYDDVRYKEIGAEIDRLRNLSCKYRFPEIEHAEHPPNFNQICDTVFKALLEDRDYVEYMPELFKASDLG